MGCGGPWHPKNRRLKEKERSIFLDERNKKAANLINNIHSVGHVTCDGYGRTEANVASR
jgi:hypothetical protein